MQISPSSVDTPDKLKTVKADCDKAPAGRAREAAIRHYLAAKAAQHAGHDGECNRKLDSARHALAQA